MAKETSTGLEFQLRVSPDQMSVLLDCPLTEESLAPLSAALREELLRMNIYHPPRTQDLEDRLRALLLDQGAADHFPIVTGENMVPPRDGYIEWSADFFTAGFVVDPRTGAMDYRERIARVTVARDELLATIIPGVSGSPGRDVLGRVVRPPKAKTPRIKPGANVRQEPETYKYYSKVDGRIRWMNGNLSVDDVYRVKGSVGLETGNISHPGALIIDKDILAGSKITTGGDIDALGLVEPCNIICGGNLTVKGGITGSSGRRIKVKGILKAKFILEAEVECDGGVVVEKEILHSTIHTRGPVDVSEGRIIGGSVNALGGITVGEAGSEFGVLTALATGVDPLYGAKLDGKVQEMNELHARSEKIHAALESLLPQRDKLPPEKQDSIKKLVEGVQEMDARIALLNEEIEALREDFNARARHEIHIRKVMHPECLITVRHRPKKYTTMKPGPLTVHSVNGELRLKGGEA